MDSLALELVQAILLRVDCSFSEFFRLSLVCQRWYSVIMDVTMLKRFFNRRFYRRLPLQLEEVLVDDEESPAYCADDRAILPRLPPSALLRLYNHNRYTQSIAHWPATVLSSPFSFSSWIWLPKDTYSLIFHVQPSTAELAYLFLSPTRNLWCVYAYGLQFSGHCQIDSEQWLFMVVNCPNSSVCSLWLDENEYQSVSERTRFHNLSRRDDTFIVRSYNSSTTYRDALIADLHVFPFCLMRCEIQAMIEQKAGFGQIDMGAYIKEKKTKVTG